MNSESSHEQKVHSSRGLAIIVLSLLLLLAISTSGFLYWQYHRAVQNKPDKEIESIVSKLAPTISLPAEKPALSTIVDTSKLSNPVLKARSQNGDKLLVYAQAKRLILFRPSTGKVIDMLTIQDNTPLPRTE
jgi:hypothetical protein